MGLEKGDGAVHVLSAAEADEPGMVAAGRGAVRRRAAELISNMA